MFERKILSELKAWKARDHKSLVLKGQRQIGKTTVAEHFGMTEYRSYVILDMFRDGTARRLLEDNDTVDSIVDAISLYKNVELVPHESLIIVDEVQESTKARSKLRLFSEDGRYDVRATGSMLGVSDARLGKYKRAKNPDMPPVGSEEHLLMHPMDFEEFLLATGMRQRSIDRVKEKIAKGEELTETELEVFSKRFAAYSVVGGMPAAVDAFLKGGVSGAQRELDGIMATCANDINRYNEGSDATKTQECFESIPYQLSDTNKRFMYSRIDNGGSRGSAEKYGENLLWIECAGYGLFSGSLSGMREPLPKFAERGVFKVYMSDTGLLMNMMGPESRVAALSGDTSFDFGAVTENSVAACLHKNGYGLSYYRRTSGTDKIELDFVIECGGMVCVEVRTGAGRDYPSLRKTLNDPNVSRRVEFEKGNLRRDEDGIEHYPLFAAAFLFPRKEEDSDEGVPEEFTGDPFGERALRGLSTKAEPGQESPQTRMMRIGGRAGIRTQVKGSASLEDIQATPHARCSVLTDGKRFLQHCSPEPQASGWDR